MLSFPTNPNIGDVIEIEGVQYKYNGTGWEKDVTALITKSTPVGTDLVLIQDSEDAGKYKVVTVASMVLNEEVEW